MSEQQKPVDYVTRSRRFFETPWPGRRRKLFVKRSAVTGECPRSDRIGRPLGTRPGAKESLINEARAIEYVRKHTTIPVPRAIAAFEDRGAFYLIQEHLVGMHAATVPESAVPYISEQLEGFVKQLQGLRSDTVRSFVEGQLFTVPRLDDRDLFDPAEYAPKKDGYVLCHGDLGWHNIIVDPDTFKINAIFDWEYAGFFPEGVEGEHWRRRGVSSANIRGDRVDTTDISRSLYEVALRAKLIDEREDGEAVKVERLSMYEGVNIARVINISWPPPQPVTKLQERIQHLDLGYPDDLPLTHRTLGIQRLICTRESIAATFHGLAVDMKEDAAASSSWTRGSGNLDKSTFSTDKARRQLSRSLEHEALSMNALYELLPELHRRLADRLNASSKPLQTARDALAYVPIPDIGQPVPATLHVASPGAEKGTTTEVPIPTFRAETYRKVEAETWEAFHEYAKRLLLVSHAALQLLPYLPEDGDAQPFTPERILVEHRAKHVVEGGDGGWKLVVADDVDVVAELKKRDGNEVAAWGLENDRLVAEERLRREQRAERESRMKEKRETLRQKRAQAAAEKALSTERAEQEAGADVAKPT